ncbi:LIM domain-containing protein [Phanerochaete sordida]|uniref:LIM domain-containing protein n=1 Tax=Phanerochaete sordida TaxID=48140 RepID=A0A9P3L9S1_9APHY|nr:LIM domain-containing protein [Phanerochaete sordida]
MDDSEQSLRKTGSSTSATSHEELTNAIETIMAVDRARLSKDESGSSFERIYSAASVIIAFLDMLKAERDGMLRLAALLAPLLDVLFMDRLFELRRTFHDMAAAFGQPDDAVALVCWVDHILARLGSTSLHLLKTASVRVDVTEDALQTILKHRDDSVLHAASQLPHSWEDMITLIGSEHASPAAVRLALHLLYAVYVIKPHLSGASNETNKCSPSRSLLHALQSYIHRRHDSLVLDQRVAEAMAVSLFAAADMALDKAEQSPFRPHTQATLLGLMHAALPPLETGQDVLSPVIRPQPQLTALCGCGSTVEWSWAIWDDERINDYDVVLRLTATWLYHLGSSDSPSSWGPPLLDALAKNPDAATIVIAALLRRAKTQALSSRILSDDVTDVVHKCTQAAAWLVNACEDIGHGLCYNISKAASGLFVLLGDTAGELKVKDIVIELLSYVPPNLFSDSISELSREARLNLKNRLDDKLRALRKAPVEWTSSQRRAATQLLQFITLTSHAALAVTTCFHSQCLVSFFKQVIAWFASPEAAQADESPRLLQALLTALLIAEPSILELDMDRRTHSWTDEDIWALAIDFKCHGVLTKAAFASFVIASLPRRKCDALWHAMALDCLRDFLFELTTLQHADEDETLSMYARMVTMSAIGNLVDHAAENTGKSCAFLLCTLPADSRGCTSGVHAVHPMDGKSSHRAR